MIRAAFATPGAAIRPTGRSAGLGSAENEPLVQVEGLTKRFPQRRSWSQLLRHPGGGASVQVLRGVGLEVRRGEFFGLLGPNGAGKTTLFKILSALILPDDGTVRVAGLDVVRDARRVREILTPVIADDRSLYWRLSGPENLCLFAALYGVKSCDRRDRANRLLGIVGLEEAGNRMVGAYSSGMKQRLLIARALLSKPRVLLLDEPTRSLDPLSARDFRRFLREEIVDRQGCTVILATHDAEEALDLCDRLALLHGGEIVALGTALELAGMARHDRLRIVVPDDQVTAAERALTVYGVNSSARDEPSEYGWKVVESDEPHDAGARAGLLRHLGASGISVAEFTRVPLSLADLMESLLRRRAAT